MSASRIVSPSVFPCVACANHNRNEFAFFMECKKVAKLEIQSRKKGYKKALKRDKEQDILPSVFPCMLLASHQSQHDWILIFWGNSNWRLPIRANWHRHKGLVYEYQVIWLQPKLFEAFSLELMLNSARKSDSKNPLSPNNPPISSEVAILMQIISQMH